MFWVCHSRKCFTHWYGMYFFLTTYLVLDSNLRPPVLKSYALPLSHQAAQTKIMYQHVYLWIYSVPLSDERCGEMWWSHSPSHLMLHDAGPFRFKYHYYYFIFDANQIFRTDLCYFKVRAVCQNIHHELESLQLSASCTDPSHPLYLWQATEPRPVELILSRAELCHALICRSVLMWLCHDNEVRATEACLSDGVIAWGLLPPPSFISTMMLSLSPSFLPFPTLPTPSPCICICTLSAVH